MKRSEFVDIVNSVMDEERQASADYIKELRESKKGDMEFLVTALIEAHIRATEVAAITVGKIIEKAGLLQFDPESPE